jgi:hypothetical protein
MPWQNHIAYNQKILCERPGCRSFPEEGGAQMDVKRIVLGAAILLVVVAGILYVSGRREQQAPEQVAELPVLLEFMMPT